MDITQPLALLGGLTPQAFMKRHWHKKPLLVRQAVPELNGPNTGAFLLGRAVLFDLAAMDSVESRLISHAPLRTQRGAPSAWQLKSGPLQRRSLPALKQPRWTLLVQGLDLHHDGIRALMDRFRFVPDARLDDIMASFATEGGGVGPHFDSYDVFLLQVQGRRRWQISQQKDLTLVDGAPLKILANFVPEQTFVLDPGDMLYLPPGCAHDGVALNECITYSIGFQAPRRGELARDLLLRMADDVADGMSDSVSENVSDFVSDNASDKAPDTPGSALYRDSKQVAVSSPGEIPLPLRDFAQAALARALRDPHLLARVLGEYLTEPKPSVWFEASPSSSLLSNTSLVVPRGPVQLDRRTKMMFDARHVFINGESFVAGGRDARLMKQLADERSLDARRVAQCSAGAQELLDGWIDAGWIHER